MYFLHRHSPVFLAPDMTNIIRESGVSYKNYRITSLFPITLSVLKVQQSGLQAPLSYIYVPQIPDDVMYSYACHQTAEL